MTSGGTDAHGMVGEVSDMSIKRTETAKVAPIPEVPIVRCPGCKVAMHVIGKAPSSEVALEGVIFRCPTCGTETQRLMRAGNAS